MPSYFQLLNTSWHPHVWTRSWFTIRRDWVNLFGFRIIYLVLNVIRPVKSAKRSAADKVRVRDVMCTIWESKSNFVNISLTRLFSTMFYIVYPDDATDRSTRNNCSKPSGYSKASFCRKKIIFRKHSSCIVWLTFASYH